MRISPYRRDIDPAPLVAALGEQGIDENAVRLDARYRWLAEKANAHPWIREGVNWLLENRPPEPARLAICHDDFHPLNILVQGGRVSGVLDWPGFKVADPVLDVANTTVLLTIPYKHLAPSLGPPDLPSIDWNEFVAQYLGAYGAHRPLDRTHMEYYRVRRSIYALIEGREGQAVWQHPLIVRDLIEYIRSATAVRLAVPEL